MVLCEIHIALYKEEECGSKRERREKRRDRETKTDAEIETDRQKRRKRVKVREWKMNRQGDRRNGEGNIGR